MLGIYKGSIHPTYLETGRLYILKPATIEPVTLFIAYEVWNGRAITFCFIDDFTVVKNKLLAILRS